MSFVYRGVMITMQNYQEVFRGYSMDVLDEVRSAVLDDTPIGLYIDKCKEDSYKLGQIRMAIREYVPIEYLNYKVSGKSINLLRKVYTSGISVAPILPYITQSPYLKDSSLERVLESVLNGSDITKIDFRQVPDKNVDIICLGLEKGYPMWLCADNPDLEPDYIKLLMRGMKLGIDIHPFLNGLWGKDQITYLFTQSRDTDINNILCYVNYKFETDALKEVVDAKHLGVDIRKICVQEKDGEPIYNCYQMEVMKEAMKQRALTNEMCNPNISDMDMRDMMEKEIARQKSIRKPVLSGQLRKD